MSRWRTWGEIPTFMKNDFTLKYYRHLSRKRTSMVFKRFFDVIMSAVLLVLLSPVILVLAVWIKVDSRGPVFFRQERITHITGRSWVRVPDGPLNFFLHFCANCDIIYHALSIWPSGSVG